jgi:hypothetical protein
MITVYVWDYTATMGKSGNWGHASMEVTGGTPAGTQYYSWWPQSENRQPKLHESIPIYEVLAIRNRTFADDCRDEGDRLPKNPDHKITISSLDETKVKAYWQNLLDNDPKWSTLGQNCSTTVARALMAGGGDSKVKLKDWWHQWNVVWAPDDVVRYAVAISAGSK